MDAQVHVAEVNNTRYRQAANVNELVSAASRAAGLLFRSANRVASSR